MRVGLIPTMRDSFALFSANAGMLCLEFAAATVAGMTACALFFPGSFLDVAVARPGDARVPSPISPYTICLSLAQAIAAASATGRLWRARFPDRQPISAAPVVAPLLVMALLVDHLFLLGLGLFILPGLLIMAVTTVFVPALIIERQGWRSLARSFEMTRPHLLALSGIWALVLIPVVILSVVEFRGPPVADATMTQLWLSEIASSYWTPVVNGFATAMCVTIYIRLTDLEAGGTDPGIFR